MNELSDVSRILPTSVFLSGVYMSTFAGASLFFLKFWMKTKEVFFLQFGFACSLISIERVFLLFQDPTHEPQSWCYLFRLAAFLIIFYATVRLNQRATR